MRRVEVHLDRTLVGRLSVDDGVRPTAQFTYDPTWLARPEAYAIDPELGLSAAPFTRTGSLFGAIRDSAPDQWGRGLLARAARGRVLGEADYLLDVDDHTRQGALRYRDPDGDWLTTTALVPVLLDLPRLQRAAREAESGDGPPLRELAAAGAGTGGARPKVVVSDGSDLWIAKFGRRDDAIAAEPAEHVVARLARRAGIETSETRLDTSGGEPVLLSRRFDRAGSSRRGYLSALSLLEHSVGAGRAGLYDYIDVAEVLPELSSRPDHDLRELWRRIAFGILVHNTDDHMRNHAFLRDDGGWRLSPAFDVNADVRTWNPFVTSVDGVAGDGRAEALLGAADYFRLTTEEARQIVADVIDAARTIDELLDERVPDETADQLRRTLAEGIRQLGS